MSAATMPFEDPAECPMCGHPMILVDEDNNGLDHRKADKPKAEWWCRLCSGWKPYLLDQAQRYPELRQAARLHSSLLRWPDLYGNQAARLQPNKVPADSSLPSGDQLPPIGAEETPAGKPV